MKLIFKYIRKYPRTFSIIVAFSSAFLVIFLCGCTTVSFKGNCKQNALYTAATFLEEGYKVRVVFGKATTPGETHVQSQAFVNGEWRWLERVRGNEVITGRQHGWFTPDFSKIYDPITILAWCMF